MEGVLSKWLAPCSRLTDGELESRLKLLAAHELRTAVHFVAHLIEADTRRLYAEAGHPSLFAYCTRELGLSEDVACKRIRAARAAAEFPMILDAIADGGLHLAAVSILAPHLTPENHPTLLEQARGKSKREVEFLAAELAPGPRKRDYRHSIKAVSKDHARLSFDAEKPLLQKIERARQLLLHNHPNAGLEDIFNEALAVFLERKDWDRRPQVRKSVEKPEPDRRDSAKPTRRIPLEVRQEVWRRDGGCCAFRSPAGRHCAERGGLEFDHILPWALGGPSDRPENIRLLCRAHNQLAAVKAFGDKAEHRRAIRPTFRNK